MAISNSRSQCRITWVYNKYEYISVSIGGSKAMLFSFLRFKKREFIKFLKNIFWETENCLQTTVCKNVIYFEFCTLIEL